MIFKIPFCGDEWVVNIVVSISARPRVEYVGGDVRKTLLISSTVPFFGDNWSVDLDHTYTVSSQELRNVGGNLWLDVSSDVLRRYRKLILRSGDANSRPLVLDLPIEAGLNGADVGTGKPNAYRKRVASKVPSDQPKPPDA